MGDPRLRKVSTMVDDFGSTRLKLLIDELWDLMEIYGGVGLAAPQVGISERIVVFGMESHPTYEELGAVEYTVLINPVVTPIGDEREVGWEGCLSVPGMRGLVPRYRRIEYRGCDIDGNPICRAVSDYHARIVQHECDHLDGILYPDRMTDLTQFGFEEEISSNLAEATVE